MHSPTRLTLSSLCSPNRAPKIDTAITDTPRNRPRYTQILNRVSADLSPEGAGTAIQVVPFVRGRRPTDDARHPGLGSSDHAALVLGGETDTTVRTSSTRFRSGATG